MAKNSELYTEIKTWQIILFLGVLLVALTLGIFQFSDKDGSSTDNGPVIVNASSCKAAGGNWDACGSACRGQEDEDACIAVCVEYCECTSENQCPFGSECINFIDDIGVCTNTF